MQTDEEPYTGQFALIRGRKIPIMNADKGSSSGGGGGVPTPIAGEEGYVLTVQPDLSSDWSPLPTPATPASFRVTATLSNAILRTTNATVIVAAPGTGKIVIPESITIVHVYGGTNVWVGTPTLNYQWGVATAVAMSSPTWASASKQFRFTNGFGPASTLATGRENTDFSVRLSAGLTGNAANDNTAIVTLIYSIADI